MPAASAAVSGCSSAATVTACPAIGWLNTVTVELDGDAGSVADLVLCTDGDCPAATTRDRTHATADPGSRLPVPFRGARVDEDTWTFSYDMSTPDQLTLRAYDTTWTVLTEDTLDATWERTGGSARCGGPGRATVRLTIP